jgi:hypothetical protein
MGLAKKRQKQDQEKGNIPSQFIFHLVYKVGLDSLPQFPERCHLVNAGI